MRLTLSHVALRAPGSYGASSALTMTPSWPAASASSRKASTAPGLPGDDPRDDQLRREEAGQGGEPLGGGTVDEILVVEMQAVEKERGQRYRRPGLPDVDPAAESPHRLLEPARAAVGPQSDQLPVEDDGLHRERLDGADNLRAPGRSRRRGCG